MVEAGTYYSTQVMVTVPDSFPACRLSPPLDRVTAISSCRSQAPAVASSSPGCGMWRLLVPMPPPACALLRRCRTIVPTATGPLFSYLVSAPKAESGGKGGDANTWPADLQWGAEALQEHAC